jgi:hypothetical protein
MVHSEGKRLWLWLPVFSELTEREAPVPSVSFRGQIQQGISFMPGEDFKFVCPSSAHNINIAYTLYRNHFFHLTFDGVFLDKIRHASFAGGLENGFGCFCENCKAAYARQGVNADEIIERIKNNTADFIPYSYAHGLYCFKDKTADDFFRVKSDFITAAIREVSAKFRQSGLAVALDVFAPMLSYLVGQNLQTLCENTAFIKPMMYRITHAPAGMPFELKWLQTSFASQGVDFLKSLEQIWGTDDLCSADSMEAQLKSLPLNPSLMNPGIEVNIVPGVCDSTPEYVSSAVSRIESMGFDKIVLSWNLLAGTGNNLEALYINQ